MNPIWTRLRPFCRIATFNIFRFRRDVRLFALYIIPLTGALVLLVRFGIMDKGGACAAIIGGLIGGMVTLFLVLPVRIAAIHGQRTEVLNRITELKYRPSHRVGDAVIYRPASAKIQQWEGNRIVVFENPDASITLECPLGIAHRFEFDRGDG